MRGGNLQNDLLAFLDASPTPFHATRAMAEFLSAAGFCSLNEADSWSLSPGKYYYTRGDSSIIAFVLGSKPVTETGVNVVGAHTDSPCLKVKPNPEVLKNGYQQLGIEVYGGALLNPWYDRDLSLAGKVNYLAESGALQSALINFEKPIAIIPSLAIHLDRTANKDRTVNPQTDMNPILFQGEEKTSFKTLLMEEINRELGDSAEPEVQAQEILDYNLSFYDTQNAAVVGLNEEFIASARLDNLLSCFVGMKALSEADPTQTSVLICNDHEEVGSCSDIGAAGNMLESFLQRLLPDSNERQIAMSRSFMISADNAHGIHPNYPAKHDDNHGPLLNNGPVLKFDANQSYATSSDSASFVRWLAKSADEELPLQSYVTRADMRCGSTIGPITASAVGIQTVDIGVPTFGMHSIREMAGAKDIQVITDLLVRFFTHSLAN